MNIKQLFVIVLISVSLLSFSQDYRYTKTLFSSSTVTSDIVYCSVPILDSPFSDESATTVTSLTMDIYQPTGDVFTQRPVIIFAHGGGFVEGNKNVDDMTAFCDSFARKGYVTVSINYRQGVEVYDNGDLHYTRAAYRGLQDGRAAIRYLRANAIIYGIDTSKIYWGGNSAGSFIGLNSIFMDESEKPAYAGDVSYVITVLGVPTTYTGPDLGDIDSGDNLSYSGEPTAVMSCWGGVGDTSIINANNNNNLFLVHGTADDIVDFNSGTPFGLTGVSAVYGSNSINTRLNSVGIPAQMTYFVSGAEHEFYGVTNGNWTNDSCGNEYWDTIVTKATMFYHLQHKPSANFRFTEDNLVVYYADTSVGADSWFWDFGDGNTSTIQNPQNTYSTAGNYNVKLYIENSILSWDTVSYNITVGNVGVNINKNKRVEIFPNPTKTYFSVNISGQVVTEVSVIDITGKEVLTEINSSIIDLSNYSKGVYFIRVKTNSGNLFVSKLIKE